MPLLHYSNPPLESFLPLETIVGADCESIYLKNGFLREITVLKNKSTGGYYLYREMLGQWPFGKSVDKFTGLYEGKYFELCYEYRFFDGEANSGNGGPLKAILCDKNGIIFAKTEKIAFQEKQVKDVVIRPKIQSLHTPCQTYRLQHKKYLNTIGFFDLYGYPQRDLDLYDADDNLCAWAGLVKPAAQLKVFRQEPDMHILMSLFYMMFIKHRFKYVC